MSPCTGRPPRRPTGGPRSFGFISCLGVLHHLEDPNEASTRLSDSLAPGGSSWSISTADLTRPRASLDRPPAARELRRSRRRMPSRARSALVSWPLALLPVGHCRPGGAAVTRRRPRVAATLPLAAYHGQPMRALWLDTFDRLERSHRTSLPLGRHPPLVRGQRPARRPGAPGDPVCSYSPTGPDNRWRPVLALVPYLLGTAGGQRTTIECLGTPARRTWA